MPSKKPAKQNKIKPFKFGKFSPKATHFIDHSNAFINIQHGSVRASKTINADVRWLEFLAESPHDEFLITGKTRDTLYRNVIHDLIKMIDGKLEYDYSKMEGILEIEGKTCWLMGFNDEGVTDKIKGMTIAGWYSDETNTGPKSAIEMAISRMSLEGAKAFWTMNADNPYHYIYTDFITNNTVLNDGTVKVWHLTLEDNPNLSQEYIDKLKKIYSSSELFYKRYIQGLWVMAEGAIYDRFIESQHTFTDPIHNQYDHYVISTDYGIASATVFGLFGIKQGINGDEYHLLREDYIESSKEGKQLTDEELADRAFQLFKELPLTTFYVPHDASSLRATLNKRHHDGMKLPVRTYTPDVLNDIRTIQKLITDNKFKIHTSCQNSIMQAQTYIWDAKAQQRGESRPLKVNDHCPDMWRAALIGTRQIGNKAYATSEKRFDYTEN